MPYYDTIINRVVFSFLMNSLFLLLGGFYSVFSLIMTVYPAGGKSVQAERLADPASIPGLPRPWRERDRKSVSICETSALITPLQEKSGSEDFNLPINGEKGRMK